MSMVYVDKALKCGLFSCTFVGSFGIPQEVVAERACRALKELLKSGNTDPLPTIIFTDINQYMIECFTDEVDKLVEENLLVHH